MKKFLLPETGRFYKANLHCHTTVSDGKRTPEQLKAIYKSKGYSIVAYTDHNVMIPHHELDDEEFLALTGFEYDVAESGTTPGSTRKCCHICFIALGRDNHTQPFWNRERYVWGNACNYIPSVVFDESEPDAVRVYSGEAISQVMSEGREKGFFVTYNHPTWSREVYTDYVQYRGMSAFEMFNGSCISMGYNDYNPRVYDDLLHAGIRAYAIGADDNHNAHPDNSRRSDSGVAWTCIKAEKLDYEAVTSALADGHFYSSEGPEIYELWFEDGEVHIRTSPVDRIECVYGIRRARVALSEDGSPITEAVFPFAPNEGYFRLTVKDARGKVACTNAYFADELYSE
jgi:hypothetical protein